ncbi:Hypothetical predicted protein [Olea europaea subsp. europaea]|uniref:Uncharacterized protein n=2 Tax=Olea europaea subsp. europaea TaxID=158383 RepID=A0A8S0V6B4_OLEEU|nr:Hypothetical predicted protein [Olea europaea subsp. europaea]
MEGRKMAVFFTVYVVVMIMGFAEIGAMAASEIVGAPAPAPGMESVGVALYVPAAMAAITIASLAAMFF